MQMQQYQQMQMQRNMQLQQRNPNHPINSMNSEGMMGQPSASLAAMKMYEELMKHPQLMVDLETSSGLIDANRMTLMKSASNQQWKLMQGILEHVYSFAADDIKAEVNLGMNQNLSSLYGQAILQSKSGLGGQGN